MGAAAAELSAEEQALFDSMRDDKAPANADDGAAAKDAAEKAAKDAKDAADKSSKDAAEKSGNAEKAKDEAKKADGNIGAALKEAREQNKTLHKELDTMKALIGAADTKLAKFMETVSKKAEAAAPKFEDDPAGALKAENEELKKGLAEVQQRLAKQDQAGDNASKLQMFAAHVQGQEKEFSKENKDYYEAADYVAALWRDEFVESGFPEKDVPQMVFQKSLAMTHSAVNAGKNAAEAIYKIAKRNGFAAAAKQEDAKKDEKSEGASKLEAIRKGQDAAKANGGGKGPDDLTLASLAQMDDDQIEKLVADPDWWAKNVRRSPLH